MNVNYEYGTFSPLIVEHLDRISYKLHMPFSFEHANGKDRVVVPVDFVSDGASIHILRNVGMWFLHSLLATYGLKAAIIHDYIYRTPGLGYSRQRADLLFRDALRAEGVSRWRTWLLYQGVHIFGLKAWLRYGRTK